MNLVSLVKPNLNLNYLCADYNGFLHSRGVRDHAILMKKLFEFTFGVLYII